jgi:hypothetical protein
MAIGQLVHRNNPHVNSIQNMIGKIFFSDWRIAFISGMDPFLKGESWNGEWRIGFCRGLGRRGSFQYEFQGITTRFDSCPAQCAERIVYPDPLHHYTVRNGGKTTKPAIIGSGNYIIEVGDKPIGVSIRTSFSLTSVNAKPRDILDDQEAQSQSLLSVVKTTLTIPQFPRQSLTLLQIYEDNFSLKSDKDFEFRLCL